MYKTQNKKFVPKETYICYLNGKLYGKGDLEYIHELFIDYVINCNMYGQKECDFKIVRESNGGVYPHLIC